MIAKEIRETAEIISSAAGALEGGHLRVLISQTPSDQDPVSIFSAGDECGKNRLPLSWTSGRNVDLEIAAGDVQKLPPVPYVLVSSEPVSSVWELTWRVDQYYDSCVKTKGSATCPTKALKEAGLPVPTLRLRIGWHGHGKNP